MQPSAVPDFRRFFETGPDLYIVVTSTFQVIAVSDAYLSATMLRRETTLHRAIFELFPDNPDDPHTDGQRRVRESFDRVLATKQPDVLPIQKYDIRRPDGQFEERFWRLSSQPILDDAGNVSQILHHVEDVTQSTQMLRRSQEQYRFLAESMPQIVFTAEADGRIDYYSQVLAEYTGQPVSALLGYAWKEVIHPDDLPATIERWAHCVATGEPYQIEHRIRRADGVYRWFLVRAKPMHSGQQIIKWFGTSTDVHDIRHATEQLRASEERLRRVVDVGIVPIAFFTLAGKVTQANDAYLHMLGYSRDELNAGLIRWDTLTPRQWILQTEQAIAALRSAGRYSPYEKQYLRKDGSQFWALFGGAMVSADEGVVFTLDITERKALEQERLGVLEVERAARLEAERAGRIKDEFLATLSHELRTPLNAILGWAQILSRPNVSDEDFAQGIETIERNARAQTQIIDDLLDMSRIVSGKIRLDVQHMELQGVMDAAVESVRPFAEAKGVRVKKMIDPLAGPVSGDPSRLQQVLWNLLINAIKFTPRGGLVQVLLERVNSHLEITVSDNGQGITPDFLPHVFERFRQQDSSTTRAYGGLGLGLSIAKQLVELHSGTIRAKSAGTGEGATFVVALPLAPLRKSDKSRTHPTAGAAPLLGDESASLEGLTVLVVDDEPDARSLIKRVLIDAHANVVLAANVPDALAALATSSPDLIVSDIGMPGQDGYELMRRIRALPLTRGGRTPAIALTAFARSADRTRAMLAGYQVHIAKPIEPRELVATLASLAGRTGHTAPSNTPG